jgi:alanine-glyoxylate transaminase/serine-glyoxylate transaminase/serine-pyruvate transaminase
MATATFPPLAPPTRFLFGPGPTQVEERVYRAMSQPIVGLLDPYFLSVVADIRAMLREGFGTANPFTLPISGTGSAGMETAVSNFLEPGQKMAVFCAGFFADRLAEMGRRYGAEVIRYEHPWGQTFSAEEARDLILRDRPHLIAYVQAETSTGAFQDGRAISAAAREVGALVIADCVTSLGAMPVQMDEQGIDIAYSCSQKGLSCPPGLAPFSASERAIARLKQREQPNRNWYLDLRLIEEYFDGNPRKYHHTPSITMFYALREGLLAASEEGWPARWERHRQAHLQFVAGIESLGLELFIPEGHRIWNLVTVRVPAGHTDLEIRQRLLSRHHIEILGGFGPLAGQILRVGLMGPLATPDKVAYFLSSLKDALQP